jgi:hypothetical protein
MFEECTGDAWGMWMQHPHHTQGPLLRCQTFDISHIYVTMSIGLLLATSGALAQLGTYVKCSFTHHYNPGFQLRTTRMYTSPPGRLKDKHILPNNVCNVCMFFHNVLVDPGFNSTDLCIKF